MPIFQYYYYYCCSNSTVREIKLLHFLGKLRDTLFVALFRTFFIILMSSPILERSVCAIACYAYTNFQFYY